MRAKVLQTTMAALPAPDHRLPADPVVPAREHRHRLMAGLALREERIRLVEENRALVLMYSGRWSEAVGAGRHEAHGRRRRRRRDAGPSGAEPAFGGEPLLHRVPRMGCRDPGIGWAARGSHGGHRGPRPPRRRIRERVAGGRTGRAVLTAASRREAIQILSTG